jgi:hypothetical protein
VKNFTLAVVLWGQNDLMTDLGPFRILALLLLVVPVSMFAQISKRAESFAAHGSHRSATGARPRTFSVRDDIEMVHFEDPSEHLSNPTVQFSPDYGYFAVITERGIINTNVVESALWVFQTNKVLQDLHSSGVTPPAGRAPLLRMTATNAPVIFDLEWLDSSRLTFRAQKRGGGFQLLKVSAKTGALTPISAEEQNVGLYGTYDGRNGNSVYTVLSPLVKKELEVLNRRRVAKVGTGSSLDELLHLSSDGGLSAGEDYDWRELWAVIRGKRFRVNPRPFQEPLHISATIYSRGVTLSPDGHFALVALPVSSVPQKWSEYSVHKGQVLFSKFRPGPQNVNLKETGSLVYQFMLIDLIKGTAEPLLDAPIGASGGYHHPRLQSAWSSDGRSIALVNTYLPLASDNPMKGPCIAVLNRTTRKGVCLEPIAANDEEESHERFTSITRLQFDPTDAKQLSFSYQSVSDPSPRTLTYHEERDGSWARVDGGSRAAARSAPIEVTVQQSLNDPPRLVAVDKSSGRTAIILDPNATVREIDLGEASEYRWNDDSGRDFVGALVMSPNYIPGRRYPLVIQTHGLFRNQFISSGGLTSAFAARALAAAGIVVLQVDDQPCTVNYGSTPAEAACAISAYESAVKKLIADGLVDKAKIGIIGFSQTCVYVLGALTTPNLKFAAATISDGDTGGYLGFVTTIGHPFGDQVLNQELGRIGAVPVGEGLKKWITESPVFNMDKVSAPLRIEAVGNRGTLEEWEPYAILRYMHKPTDLMLIDYGTHPLSNPAERLASQGGNVDWFRFWLKGEEDSDPAKADQYTRWRALRKMQEENNHKAKSAPTN